MNVAVLPNPVVKTRTCLTYDPHYAAVKRSAKSPLRYPGGKSRAARFIVDEYIKNQRSVCSPFVGGASIELELASRGTQVFCYDNFEPLVVFWQELLNDPIALAKIVEESYYTLSSTMFYNLQKTFCSIKDRMECAACFYAINRSSFSGTTLSGGMSPGHPRFTISSIQRLRDFKVENFTVSLLDFKESIPKHKDDFLYCDPPYLIDQKLYGVRGDKHIDFDHEALSELLKARGRWVLSYNDCPEIRRMYHNHSMLKPEWTYGMGNSKKSNELIILSRDFS
ncbi:MAG: DNA adenine methylase [Treponema sp.]|jgi:DNA adenine methylase|nr:DNA adenine methylase [Treponema sp.]